MTEFLNLTKCHARMGRLRVAGFAFHPDFNRADSPKTLRVRLVSLFSGRRSWTRASHPPSLPATDRLSRFTVPEGSLARRPELRAGPDQSIRFHNLWH